MAVKQNHGCQADFHHGLLGLLALAFGISYGFAVVGQAMPFTNGNLLISTEEVLYEYTASGTFVQSAPIPYPGGSHPVTESARDVVVNRDGQALVYNGTFDPYLSTFDPGGMTWSHTTFSAWSTVNNGSYGGIAARGQFVFTTDMDTFGDEAMGVVRFDTSQDSAIRFAAGIEPIDLNLGLDGLLYVLYPGGSPEGRMLDVYNPDTLQYIRTLDLTDTLGHTGHRSVAVNVAGDIFLADWDGDLQRLDLTGALVDSVDLSGIAQTQNLHDVHVAPDGTIVVGDRFGGIVVTDEDFNSPFGFSVGDRDVFVTIVPESSTILLLLMGSGVILGRHRRQS